MNLFTYVLPILFLILSACTWVELTKEGKEVAVATDLNLKTCKKLGSTTSTVKHKIGFVTRSEEKVNEELTTLAKNSAAKMGGDTIVAEGAASEGTMSFDIYKCKR